tara:strand:- start:1762 stop:2682 length:921 start_codon:yes stop_codon:yes gene_type:complete
MSAFLDWLIPQGVMSDVQTYGRTPRGASDDPFTGTELTLGQFKDKYLKKTQGTGLKPKGGGRRSRSYFDFGSDFDDPNISFGGETYNLQDRWWKDDPTMTSVKNIGYDENNTDLKGYEYVGDPDEAAKMAYEDYQEMRQQYQQHYGGSGGADPYYGQEAVDITRQDLLGGGRPLLEKLAGTGERALGITGAQIGDPLDPQPEHLPDFTTEDFRKLHSGYYSDLIGEGRDVQETSLAQGLQSAGALGSGFAGYGGREKKRETARGSYLQGIENVYAGVDTRRKAALERIYGKLDELEAYQEPYIPTG